MRKETMITRTIKEAEVSVLCYDRENACEMMEEITVPVLPGSKHFESVVKSKIREGLIFLEISNMVVKENKYGCSLTDFMSVAHKIPAKETEKEEEK